MRKILFGLFLLLTLSVRAQEIRVVEHLKVIKDTYATMHPITDPSGKICAVIKIGIKLDNVKFLGDSIVSQKKGEGSEYIVHVIPGCKKITVSAEPLLPFEYEFPEDISAATTYRLMLDIHDVRVVEHLKELEGDNYAMMHRVDDKANNPCAVIKVGIKLPDVRFENTYLKEQKKGTGTEYIVYVAEGCKMLTIHASSILPFEYPFSPKDFPRGLKAGKTYGLLLDIPKVIESLVKIRTNAKNAKLQLAGQIYEPVRQGLFELRITKGVYDYTLSSDLPGFKEAKGKIDINDVNVDKRIDLISEQKYSLSIQADDNALITIDGELLDKRGSQQITLPAGLHEVKASLESEGLKWENETPVEIDMSSGNASVNITLRGNLRIVYPTNAKFEIIPQPGAVKPGQKTIQSGESISLLGNYVIKVTKKNYMDAFANVQVGVDENKENFRIDVTSKADNLYYGINGKNQDYKKAFKEYQKMADKGDEIAQFKVAECLMKGHGTMKNEIVAKEYYVKASAAGIGDASLALGNMLFKTDYNEAGKYFMKGAEQGNTEAATYAGAYCVDKKDFKKALRYFQMGVDDKNNKLRPKCLELLGELYFGGLGTTKDLRKAKSLFNEAAALGNTSAKERLIDYLYFGYDGKPDKLAAANAYAKLGDKLSYKSCVRVALHHFEYQNYAIANKYFLRVKDQNVALPGDIGEKFYIMGNEMYNKDSGAAFYYYSFAYDKGVKKPNQLVRLGYMYLDGKGTGINHTKSKMFFEEAAKLNDNEGIFMLGSMYEKGRGCTTDKSMAIKLYEQAARNGYMRAYLNLGTIYAGIKNMEKAVEYWEKAANAGNKTAITNLIKYYRSKKNNEQVQYWSSKLKQK